MQFLGGGGGHKKSKIQWGCLKGGSLGSFADLRGSWRRRGGGVFEGGLILQCTLCVVSMVDTSQSGRLVTLCHMFFSQYNALLVINSIGYIFKLYMLLKVSLNLSCIFSYPNFLIKKSTLITFSLFLIYQKLVHQWFCATSLFNPPIDPTN